jgi:hypothetical protein
MKGTFFNKPIEYNINISGESWKQGDQLSGTFTVIEHSKVGINKSKYGCHLCFCKIKKFNSKDIKAIKVLESKKLISDKNELNFTFDLRQNCPITDSIGSLYIIYGDIDSPFESGSLQLKITPISPILYFTQIFEQFYRFKLRAFKNKKDNIEVLVIAPDSKEWVGIQKMAIQMKMVGDELNLLFNINIKKLDFSNDLNKTKDEKIEIIKVLTKNQYELYGIANQDGIKKVIDEVLNEIKIKPII